MKEYIDKQELLTMLSEMKAAVDEDFNKSYGDEIIYMKGQMDILRIIIGCVDNLTVQREE